EGQARHGPIIAVRPYCIRSKPGTLPAATLSGLERESHGYPLALARGGRGRDRAMLREGHRRRMIGTLLGGKRHVKVAHDLAKVTRIDEAGEVRPQDADLDPARVEAIWKAVENLYQAGVHPAIPIAVRRHGKLVMNRAIG